MLGKKKNHLRKHDASATNKEGYLLKHENEMASVFYFVLGEGSLQYYTEKDGHLVGELILAGFSVHIDILPNCKDQCPNRFVIRTAKYQSEGEIEGGIWSWLFPSRERHELELSASTSNILMQWTEAIQQWSRICWKETTVLCGYENEQEALRITMKQHHLIATNFYGKNNTAQIHHLSLSTIQL